MVEEEDVDICCCRGDGETIPRCETEEPLDRTETGDVGDRRWRGVVRGDRSRSDELFGSGEVCLESDGDGRGEGTPALLAKGEGRRGIAGRA